MSLAKLATLLSDGQYHDGTSIGQQLGVTRAAVWKMIQKLEDYGIDIQSQKGKGYLLEKPLILLDKNKIKKLLNEKSITIDLIEKIESTNDYLKNHPQHEKIHICIAEIQTHGRGRLGRVWHSPFGQNIYFSMRYAFEKDISELSGLSLVVALAVTTAITTVTNLSTLSIKWPNDILMDNKKIAGILIDVQAETNGFCQAIIGIGINVNMDTANKKDINQPWNSLQKITGNYVDRNLLCANLINTLLSYLARFSETGLSDFTNDWKQKDCLFGQSIQLMSGSKKYAGVGVGINAQGHLLLKMADGNIHAFSSGDTTLQRGGGIS